MANNQLTQHDFEDLVNRLIREVNRLLATYGLAGIVGALILFGVALLAATYLPWAFVIVALVLGAVYVAFRR